MPLDPDIILGGAPAPTFYGPDFNAIYRAQDQAYKEQLRQQDIAGQNALRQMFANPNALNPVTGLPNPASFAPVFQANPATGMDMLDRLYRINEEQQRTAASNLLVNQRYGQIFDKSIAGPTIEYARELQRKGGITPGQQQIMVDQFRRQAIDDTVKGNAIPDNIRSRWEARPYDNTWPYMSETANKRWDEIAKGWKEHIDSTGTVYYTNDYLGPGAWNQDRTAPYKPVGGERKAGQEPKERVDVTTQGNVPIFYDPVTHSYVDQDNKPYRPVNPQELPRARAPGAASERPLPAPQSVQVQQDDGSWNDAQIYRLPDGRVVDANTRKEIPSDKVRSPPQTLSGPAGEYVSERERLGARMSTTWGMSKPEIQQTMAENDIRNSLNLPRDHVLTHEDAIAAATNDVVIQKGMHAESQALTAIARQNALVQGFEGTALRNANYIRQIAPSGVAGGDQAWNKWANLVRRNLAITPDLTKLDNAVTDFKNEYVRIMTTASASGGAMTSDAARAEGERLFNVNLPLPNMLAGLDAATNLMKNRTDSIRSDYNSILQSIRNKGIVAEQPTPTREEGQESVRTAPPRAGDIPAELRDALSKKPPGNYIVKRKDGSGSDTFTVSPDGSVTMRPGR